MLGAGGDGCEGLGVVGWGGLVPGAGGSEWGAEGVVIMEVSVVEVSIIEVSIAESSIAAAAVG